MYNAMDWRATVLLNIAMHTQYELQLCVGKCVLPCTAAPFATLLGLAQSIYRPQKLLPYFSQCDCSQLFYYLVPILASHVPNINAALKPRAT